MQLLVSRSRILQPLLLAALVTPAALLAPCRASAIIYDIDRSFSGSSFTATLTGTVDVPLGSYMITNRGASPFTSANLTLTVNGTPYIVDSVVMTSIYGSGEFFIDATTTSLTFSTAHSDAVDPADLIFTDNPNGGVNALDRYGIGADGAGQFEAAFTASGSGFVADTTHFVPNLLPVEWGVAVPEPSTLRLLAVPCVLLGIRIMRARKQVLGLKR